jgi:hypothetical protein
MQTSDFENVNIRGIIAFFLVFIEKAKQIESIDHPGWDWMLDKSWSWLECDHAMEFGKRYSHIGPYAIPVPFTEFTHTEYLQYAARATRLGFSITESELRELLLIYTETNICISAAQKIKFIKDLGIYHGVDFDIIAEFMEEEIAYLEYHNVDFPPLANFQACTYQGEWEEWGLPITRAQIMGGNVI